MSRIAAGYPIDKRIADWLDRKCGGTPGSDLALWERRVRIYDRINIPGGGTGGGGALPLLNQVDFFKSNYAPYVTNLQTPNQFPANYAIAVYSLRIGFLPGFDRLGQRLGQAAPAAATILASAQAVGEAYAAATAAAATTVAVRWAETLREFLSTPIVQFNVADRQVFEIQSLLAFPDGKGLAQGTAIGSQGTLAATNITQSVFGNINNGAPVYSNAFSFGTPYPLPGGQNFGVSAKWPRAVDWADATIGPLAGLNLAGQVAGTLMCELEGDLVSLASA